MLHPSSSDRDPPAQSHGTVAAPMSGPAHGEGTGGGDLDRTPGAEGPRLEGRRIGLICESRQAPAAALFIEAAEGLGAQVAVLQSADLLNGAPGQDKLVRMLARLYDAIECQDLPPSSVRRIAELVAVPVMANLGGAALRAAEAGSPATAGKDNREEAWQQGLARVRQALLRALQRDFP